MSLNLKTESAEIDGISFETTQFAGMRALNLLGKLAGTIGPAMATFFTSGDDMALDQMAVVIAGSVRNLKEGELGDLALDILAGTSATLILNGDLRRVNISNLDAFNLVFSGRLVTMFKAIGHALKVNYSDFGVGGVLPSAPVQAVTESK